MTLVKINENVARTLNLNPQAMYKVLTKGDGVTIIIFNGANFPIKDSDIVSESHISADSPIKEQRQILRG
jgi:hypothetical protein